MKQRRNWSAPDKNQTVVRQFVTKVLVGHDVDMMDKLVVANYVTMKSASIMSDIEIEDLIAQGNSVVFRGKIAATPANGNKVTARRITFYRLAN